MTRANLNFRSQNWGASPVTLYYYHNGDQYPSGLRDHFGIIKWLENEEAFTPKGFTEWVAKNYDAVVREISHPAIYYDDGGFPTDYSYVFTQRDAKVAVYNWSKQIFEGNVKGFVKWLKEQKE